MTKQSNSSKRWLKEHFKDAYVKKAKAEGFRSRAAYKLLELHQQNKLFKSGMVVVDLGAAPGGWSQVACKLIQPKGKIVATDLLPMEPIQHVDFIQGDFLDETVFNEIVQKLPGGKAHIVLSDMAPNISGNACTDMARTIYLAETALSFALQVLQDDGVFLIKVFQGDGFDDLLLQLRQHFKSISIKKPDASRARSKELYLLCKGRKNN